MKLNKKEKQLLSIIDNSSVDDFLERSSKILKINPREVEKIIKKLQKENLIKIVSIVEKNMIYSHTKKVKKNMLDENLFYKYGSRPLHTYS